MTFSETVTGVDTADFALSATGSISGTIQSVSSLDDMNFDVTVGLISGAGTLGLDLKYSGTGTKDIVGNVIVAGDSSGETYSVSKSAPTVTAISPDSGSTAGETAVTITGTDFY